VLHTSALTSDRPDEPMGIGAFTVDIRWDP